MMGFRLGLLLAGLLAALALPACGSSESPEDEAREAALLATESEDPQEFCRQLVTEHFIDEVFDGDLQACIDSDVVEEEPGRAVVGEVFVPPDEEALATVAVRLRGGEADGVAGHLRFLDVDGEWRLDRFETDWLRSIFGVGIATVDEGAVSTPEMKRCIGKRVAALPDAGIRELSFDSLTDEQAAAKTIVGFAEKCPAALADYIADELLVAFIESGPDTPAYRRCVHDELAAFLQLTGIGPELISENPGSAATAALEGLALGVQGNCGGG